MTSTLRFHLFIPLLVGLAGVLWCFFPFLWSGLTAYQTDLGDSRFNHFLLERSYLTLKSATIFSWDGGFFYPIKGTLGFGDLLIGVAPPYWFLRLIGVSETTAFGLWMLVGGLLTYTIAYCAIRDLTNVSPFCASIGAFLCAFSAPRTAHLGHQQLWAHWYALVAMWGAASIIMRLSNSNFDPKPLRGWYIMVALSLLLQFYSGIYLAWLTVITVTIWSLTMLMLPIVRQNVLVLVRREWRLLIGLLGMFAIGLLPLIKGYAQARLSAASRSYLDTQVWLPHISDLLYFGPSHVIYGSFSMIDRFTPAAQGAEHNLGFGFITAATLALGVYYSRLPRIPPFFLATAVATIIAMMLPIQFFDDVSIWRLVYPFIPGAEAIRAPGRIILILLLPVACGVAIGLDYVKRRYTSMVLAALICIEQLRWIPSTDPSLSFTSSRSVAKALRESPLKCQAFYYTTLGGIHPQWKYQIDAMWTSLYAGMPTLNGYAGTAPKNWYLDQANSPTKAWEVRSIRLAREWIVQHGESAKHVCWVRRGKGLKPRLQIRRLQS